MNKKIILSIFLISLCCLTIVSAFSFKDALNKVIIDPFNSLITGKPISFTGKLTSVTGKSTSVAIGDLVRVPGDLISCKLYKGKPTGLAPSIISFNNLVEVADFDSCSKLFDDNDFSKISLEDKGAGTHDVDPTYGGEAGVSVGPDTYTLILTFPKVPINRIAVIPGIYLASNDLWVRSGGRMGTTVKFFNMYEPTARGNGLLMFNEISEADTIIYTFTDNQRYSPGYGVKDFLDEIIILYQGIPPLCYDTDGGQDIFWDGVATGPFKSKTDECWSLNFDPDNKKRGNFKAPSGCNRGDPVPGGYMDACMVNEAYCENGVVKQKLITCTSAAPACYDGKCACLYDEQCPDGYECKLARPDDQQNTRRTCQKLPGTQDPTPPTQPICEDTDQGNKPYFKGIVSFGVGYDSYQDECVFVSPTNDEIINIYACSDLGYYETETSGFYPNPGGYSCNVVEHHCEDDLHKIDSVGCSKGCMDGHCVCEIDQDCPSGTVCDVGIKQCISSQAVCGDNQIDIGEICDGTNLDNKDCTNLGFDAGDLACATDCMSFDTSGCTTITQGTCDDTDSIFNKPEFILGTVTTIDVGFPMTDYCALTTPSNELDIKKCDNSFYTTKTTSVENPMPSDGRCTVKEFSCRNPDMWNSEIIDCANGCYEGRCICLDNTDCPNNYDCLLDSAINKKFCESLQPCTDECNSGETGCNDDNTKSWICGLGADNCFHKVFTDCGTGEICDSATHTCLPSQQGCTDECAQGETGCSDDNTQNWICELGTDGCYDKAFTDCGTGETCDPATHTCIPEQPTGPYAGLGEDCSTMDCYIGLYCDATDVCKKCELATDCANADCEEIRIPDTDNDGINEYCEAGTSHNLIQSGEDCDYDYQCEDNICHTNGKCLSFAGLTQAYCYIKEQLGQTDDEHYLEFCVE